MQVFSAFMTPTARSPLHVTKTFYSLNFSGSKSAVLNIRYMTLFELRYL